MCSKENCFQFVIVRENGVNKIFTSSNRRLESAFDVTRLFVLWQVGEELFSHKNVWGC